MTTVALQSQDCSELFFSEYLEGSGNNKGLEIYNPTDGVINLGSYYIARYSNGSNSYVDGGITKLEGFIPAYGTHLIVNGQDYSTETSPASDPILRGMAQQLDHDYPAPTYMNGNDALALFKDTGGKGNEADFVLVDLFGIIGGGMPADGEGWASVTDQWIYRNIYDSGGSIIGQDSTYVSNYIFPDGYYFLRWWLWSANHALVRKYGVKKGITAETMPLTEFNVTVQWDTVPGGQDQWDSLNSHYCVCQYGTGEEMEEVIRSFSVFPNPAGSRAEVGYSEGMDRISIFDISGKEVVHYGSLQGIRQKVIDVGELRKGIYLVRVWSRDRVLSGKLIKN